MFSTISTFVRLLRSLVSPLSVLFCFQSLTSHITVPDTYSNVYCFFLFGNGVSSIILNLLTGRCTFPEMGRTEN